MKRAPEGFRDAAALRAARVLLQDHFHVQPAEHVVITADEHSDTRLLALLADGLKAVGATYCVAMFPRLPYQGALADPYLAAPVGAAVMDSDVWLDLSFPYLAGSKAYDRVMEKKRTRYLLLGDLTEAGFGRLYGRADFERLFALQMAVDRLLAAAQGKRGRITSPAGTDLQFIIGKPATEKKRHATGPGAQTIPGSAIFYPELESVCGVVALEAAFHEHYAPLATPLVLEVDGVIRRLRGDGADRAAMDRALRRAGGGQYGHVIHLTVGLNPGAIATGRSFIEDIRVLGHNAVGFGLPWWQPGGGENHPDGLVRNQSLWIEDEPIIEHGLPAASQPFAALLDSAAASMCP